MSDQNENNELYLEKELLAPFEYFAKMEGNLRFLKLFFTFNHWLKVPEDKVKPLWDMSNRIYVSCILCDDIQDNTIIRGVMPATHCIFGIPRTINASIHSLLLILEQAANLCPEACKSIIEDYLDVLRGQGMEIYWRDNFIYPTEEQHQKMTIKKSGRFCMIPVRLLQLFSEDKTDYSNLVYTIARFIQIHDDYCNLNHQQALEGWPDRGDKKGNEDMRFCEDITEGKFSFPITHAMQTEYGEQILNILRLRTRDITMKKYCISLIEKAGSMQYTRDVMKQLQREARVEVARLGGNPDLEAMLDQFLGWR